MAAPKETRNLGAAFKPAASMNKQAIDKLRMSGTVGYCPDTPSSYQDSAGLVTGSAPISSGLTFNATEALKFTGILERHVDRAHSVLFRSEAPARDNNPPIGADAQLPVAPLEIMLEHLSTRIACLCGEMATILEKL